MVKNDKVLYFSKFGQIFDGKFRISNSKSPQENLWTPIHHFLSPKRFQIVHIGEKSKLICLIKYEMTLVLL